TTHFSATQSDAGRTRGQPALEWVQARWGLGLEALRSIGVCLCVGVFVRVFAIPETTEEKGENANIRTSHATRREGTFLVRAQMVVSVRGIWKLHDRNTQVRMSTQVLITHFSKQL